MKLSEFIAFKFKSESPSGATTITDVVNVQTGENIGTVKWFASWRKYAFFPAVGSVYDQDCLFTVAEYCERASKDHYSKR